MPRSRVYRAGMHLDDQPTDADLIEIWQEAATAIADLAESLDEDEWTCATALPGWNVADIVAHVVDIEQHLAGDPRPAHEPQWDRLPHVAGDVSRFTEVGVDHRRGMPRQQVVADLRDVIARRRVQLDAVPAGGEVLSPFGRPTTMQRLLRMRCLDVWMHEQDVRDALDRPGHLDTRPAVITAQQIAVALPRCWQSVEAAPEGSALRILVTGPGLEADLPVGDGEPVVTLTVPWPDLVRLAAGRIAVDDAGLRSRIVVDGDQALGAALLPALSFTP